MALTEKNNKKSPLYAQKTVHIEDDYFIPRYHLDWIRKRLIPLFRYGKCCLKHHHQLMIVTIRYPILLTVEVRASLL